MIISDFILPEYVFFLNITKGDPVLITQYGKKQYAYTDSRSKLVTKDDVLYDGKIYWQILVREFRHLLLSCEKGYLHEPTPELLQTMTIIGKFEDNKELFQCD